MERFKHYIGRPGFGLLFLAVMFAATTAFFAHDALHAHSTQHETDCSLCQLSHAGKFVQATSTFLSLPDLVFQYKLSFIGCLADSFDFYRLFSPRPPPFFNGF